MRTKSARQFFSMCGMIESSRLTPGKLPPAATITHSLDSHRSRESRNVYAIVLDCKQLAARQQLPDVINSRIMPYRLFHGQQGEASPSVSLIFILQTSSRPAGPRKPHPHKSADWPGWICAMFRN
jgi:hypothetical protein